MYLCGIVMPSCRCGDCDFYTGIYISTFLVVFTAYLTVLVHLILAALFRTGTLRWLCFFGCFFRRSFRCALCGIFCFSIPGIFFLAIAGCNRVHCSACIFCTLCLLFCGILRMDLHCVCPVSKKCPCRHTKQYCRQNKGHQCLNG